MSNPHAWWEQTLMGLGPPVHESEPQCGYFKFRYGKDKPWLPAAIFMERGVLCGEINGTQADPIENWVSFAKNPISYETYLHRKETGQWPEEVGIGHNNPPIDESIHTMIKDKVEATDIVLEEDIDSQARADRAANQIAELRKLSNQCEDERKEKKQPHLDAGREVDKLFKPSKQMADDRIDEIQGKLDPWLKKEQESLRAVAIKKLQTGEDLTLEELKASAGTTGKKVSLRTFTEAKIVNWDLAIALVMDESSFQEEVQRLCNAKAGAGEEHEAYEIVKTKRPV